MKTQIKYIHEGEYVAAVQVETIEPAPGWESCITLADARKLDEARVALRQKDFKKASALGTVYHLTPMIA